MTTLRPRPAPDALRTVSAPSLPREDPITRLPILILYPHSRCNCRCLMCDIWRGKERTELSAEEIACRLDEWRRLGVRRVVLSGGEALMHSRLQEICEHLAAAGIGITLLTTGLLLKRHAGWLARCCDDVVVSLDGPAEIHDRIRNLPRAYERLAAGVVAVKAANPGVVLSGRCTVQHANFRFLRATVAAAHDLSLDRISFLAADVSSEAFNRPSSWEPTRRSEVALQADELPALTAELDALEIEFAADFAAGYISESPIKLRRRLSQYFAALLGMADFHPNQCNAPWVSSVIEADGTVRPCFFQPPLGNIHEVGSLEAVLNAPGAIAFRQNLDPLTNPICKRCVCTLNLREGA